MRLARENVQNQQQYNNFLFFACGQEIARFNVMTRKSYKPPKHFSYCFEKSITTVREENNDLVILYIVPSKICI